MSIPSKYINSNKSRILIYSQRNIYPNDTFRCPLFEFEDIISKIDFVDIITPIQKKISNLKNRIVNTVATNISFAINPGVNKISINKEYDLLIFICAFPKDLLNIVKNIDIMKNCKHSVCLVDEMWVKSFKNYGCYFKLLKKFDYVILYYSQSVEPVSNIIEKKCYFLPPGIDAIKFCPYPVFPKRFVDVYSYGRRSEITHQKLLKISKDNNLYYVYDSISGNITLNGMEHRHLLANTAKRSRYIIVNPGLIDRPEVRGKQIEIGNRYIEGAASGCIMIGEKPRNDEYEKIFNWIDAVIELPYNSEKIDVIINELDRQPIRQEQIRKNNIVQSLKRNDWLYRWETILKIVGIPLTPNMIERKIRLENISKIIENNVDE